METLTLLDSIFKNWHIIVIAFGVGGFYFQAKGVVTKIMTALENTSTTHATQNRILDSVVEKLDSLDRRVARIEGSIELIQHENNQQAVKIAVLESHSDVVDAPARPKIRRSR